MILLWATLALAQGVPRELAILDELEELDQQVHDAEAELAQMRSEQEALDAQISENQADLDRIQGTLDGSSERVAGLIRAVYHLNRRGFARIVFSAEDPSDLRRRTRYLTAILLSFDGVVRDYRADVGAKQETVERLTADREKLTQVSEVLSADLIELESQRDERRQMLETIQRSSVLTRTAEQRREATAASFDQDVVSVTVEPSGTPFLSRKGQLDRPAQTRKVLRGWGRHTDSLTGTTVMSRGVTFSCERHQPVRSVAPGAVVMAEYYQRGHGYGQVVKVDHGEGYLTIYANLGTIKVTPGQRVNEGDMLGTCGDSGVTDTLGPRVHFELRYNGSATNPEDWFSP